MVFSKAAKAIMRLTQHFSLSLQAENEGISAERVLTAGGLIFHRKLGRILRQSISPHFFTFYFYLNS